MAYLCFVVMVLRNLLFRYWQLILLIIWNNAWWHAAWKTSVQNPMYIQVNEGNKLMWGIGILIRHSKYCNSIDRAWILFSLSKIVSGQFIHCSGTTSLIMTSSPASHLIFFISFTRESLRTISLSGAQVLSGAKR